MSEKKVKCELCGRYFRSLLGHLTGFHKTTPTEYQNRFPNALLECKELSRHRSKRASEINTGRSLPIESRKKTSKTLISKNNKPNDKYRSWRRRHFNNKEEALKRDNYTCQNPDCRGISNYLEVHHIDFDSYNDDLNNLTTLCRSCHARKHEIKPTDDAWLKGLEKRRIHSEETKRKISESLKRKNKSK